MIGNEGDVFAFFNVWKQWFVRLCM